MEKIGGPPTHRCADCRSAIWNGRDFASAGTPSYPGPKPTTGYKHGPPLSDLFAIAVVALFSVASDLSSLATYFGLLSAGMPLALQNVILASLGSLVLMGKRGIRIGDRVQVSGITGDVINMGLLQFQLREFDVEEVRFTGHVATFSNSLVFVSPAIGLLKFNSAPGMAAKAGSNDNGTQREASSTGPVLEARGKD